jgi:hypothetical protein
MSVIGDERDSQKKTTRKHRDLQNEASRDVKRGQLIVASDNTPHPFNSRDTMNGASMLSMFSLGHIPKLSNRRAT